MNQQKIGKFIAERRKEKGLTQIELAEKLGVSNRTISKWENGNSMPDYSIFTDLCKELDVSINELLSGEKLTKENYQNKLEENIVSTISYSDKVNNKKTKRIIIITLVSILVIVYLLYKAFIAYVYYRDDEISDVTGFPTYGNIADVKITNNGKANTDIGHIRVYMPDGFELMTDRAKTNLVSDDCLPYIKGYKDNSFDAAVLICNSGESSVGDLRDYGIDNTLFPYLNASRIFKQYEIEDILDILKMYEKNYGFKANIFSNSSYIKLNYLIREISRLTVPSYDDFYYLVGDLRGYTTEKTIDNHYIQTAVISYKTGVDSLMLYTISFINNKEEYFNHNRSFEIISSIYKK